MAIKRAGPESLREAPAPKPKTRKVYGTIEGRELFDVDQRLDDIAYTVLRHSHRVKTYQTRLRCRECVAIRLIAQLQQLIPYEYVRE